MSQIDRTFIRYSVVGSINSLSGLLIIYSAKFSGFDDVYSNAIGYLCGLTISFFLNKNWTFQNKNSTRETFIKFSLVTVIAYFANLFTVIFLIDKVEMNGFIAQAFGIPVYSVLSYLGCRHIVFTKNNIKRQIT